MIDWWSLAFNALWILGASVMLAAVSYYRWLAGETRRTLRDVYSASSWPVYHLCGMTLVCVGWMLAQADHWWERVLWGVLAASFGWRSVESLRASRCVKADTAENVPGERDSGFE